MEKIIRQYSPRAIIKGILPHKLGPVNAIIKARELIDLNDEVVVNYCDFSCYWNWENFKLFIKKILLMESSQHIEVFILIVLGQPIMHT